MAERIAPAKRVSDFAQHGQHELRDAPFGSKVQRVEVRRGTRLPGELRQLHLPQYFSGHRPGGSGAGRRRGRFQNECFDVGHLYNLKFCIDTGMFKPPVFIQFVLGNQGASAQIWTISFHEAHRRSAVWRWLSLVGTRRCVADGLGRGRHGNGR
ncbi:3-keto-5-aminohexanoate cleavage protein [Variovorax guangxiensis]|uniref:3-keto-5-aminohexanoate cleavage protein n=1 Tax=Variovorax guangxiensis TaxID=1775474 RepID=UPI0038F74DF7